MATIRATIRPLILFGLLLAVGGCAGVPDQNPGPGGVRPQTVDPAAAVSAGERALAQGRYGEALTRFQRVVGQDPEHHRATLGLAEAHLGLGAHERAQELFLEIQDVPELRLQARQGLAIARLARGELDAAQPMLREAAAEDASLWRAWNALARTYDLQQRWDEAAAAYEKALATSPKPALVHNNRGMSLVAQARYEAAAAEFSRALELDPSLEVARTNLRLALAYQGRYAEALTGVDREDLPPTLNNLGYVALLRGDLARAEAYFLRALERSASFYAPAAKNLELLGSMRQIEASAPPS